MPSEHRLHPASLLFVLGGHLRNFLLPGLIFLVSAGSRGWDWQVWGMWLIVPFALASIVRYVSFRYRYEANEIVVKTGVLFRNERHVPYSRIQNLHAVQNLLHRALGVVEVRIETGSGNEAEAALKVLPVAAFEEMRRRVAIGRGLAATAEGAHAAGVAESGEAGAGEEVAGEGLALSGAMPPRRTILALPLREVAVYGLLEGRGLVIVAAAIGALWEAGLSDAITERLIGTVLTREQMAQWLGGAFFGGEGLVIARLVMFVAAFGVLLALLRVVAGAWGLVRVYGFTLSRVGEDLRTEYGLITRVATTIPSHRVQTLTVREGPWHRLFGRAAIDVETAGGEGEGELRAHRVWLAPLVRRDEVDRLVVEAAPDADLRGADWRRPHPRAVGRHTRKSVAVAFVVALPTVVWLGWWSLAWLAVCVTVAVVHARAYVASLRYAVGQGAVGFRSGWLWRQTSVARVAKVQVVATDASPFDRRTGMARLRVDTAGASATGHRVDIPYLPEGVAHDLHAALARRAAATEFRW